jgi:hypothetical protein
MSNQSLHAIRMSVLELAERFARGDYGDYRLVSQWSNTENGTITVEVEAKLNTASFKAITIIYEDELDHEPVRVIDYSVRGW